MPTKYAGNPDSLLYKHGQPSDFVPGSTLPYSYSGDKPLLFLDSWQTSDPGLGLPPPEPFYQDPAEPERTLTDPKWYGAGARQMQLQGLPFDNSPDPTVAALGCDMGRTSGRALLVGADTVEWCSGLLGSTLAEDVNGYECDRVDCPRPGNHVDPGV
ncbi:hypothetical protein BJ508DRAFT_301992 [Ascobolus immersus RN42]|uniref:Uncharacterized protein n=1 Tax=Ascobolus immersus RN42 TaxID=1160509 RepID=A0A3N4IKG9_ASCIM|nr:hypothetical protein BJ508DRAFT_301992 [Ascobolus immersus RN42]